MSAAATMPAIAINTTTAPLRHPVNETKLQQKEALKKAARDRFTGAYDTIRNELVEHFKSHGMPQDAVEWYTRVCSYPFIFPQHLDLFDWSSIALLQNLDYNVPGGKLNRGMSVIDTVQIIKGRELSDDEYLKAAVLGWAIEFVSPFSHLDTVQWPEA